ncbi:MAG: hypothetical protein ACRD1G_19415 [Acidimicrobiales bacterium]
MPTIADVLRGKSGLDIECVDRVYLNGYVKDWQLPGGLVLFIRNQKGWDLPSPKMLYTMTDDFHAAVEQFARQQGLEMVTFEKGDNKDDLAQAALARCPTRSGVILIGKAQEASTAFKGRRADKGTKVWFTYSRCRVRVTPYYFYLHDEDFGLAFIKVCSYAPFEVKVCFNGHEWAKQQLRREGIAFEALENGFAWCADPARLQDLCHQLTADTIRAFVDRWIDQLPWPLTAAERAEGYRHDLSIWQLEVSRTQVFDDPEQGRALVETLIRETLDLGRPDRVRVICERPVTKRTPGEFSTQVLQHGVLPSIRIHYKHSALKQYFKEGRALRTEMMINNPSDLGYLRGVVHFAALVALGRAINQRLLQQEEVSQDCFVSLDAVRSIGRSTVDERGQRAPALRFGDERAMALLGALAHWGHIPAGLSNRSLRQHVAALLRDPAYSSAHMSYDLRRLRLKGLIRRTPHTQTYVLTALGVKVAHFFTKLYTRLFRPGLAALPPHQPVSTALGGALAALSTIIHTSVLDAQLGAPMSS